MVEDCRLCKLISRGRLDPTFVIELNKSFVFIYRDQSYHGRTIVVLKNHVENFSDLDESELTEFYREALIVAKAVQRAFSPDLINFAMLGNRIRHLHWHIIPRRKGDYRWGKAPWPHPRVYFRKEERYREMSLALRSVIEEISKG